ncbi:hypothetical protein GGX14DRAFT_574065 [Mycena pura]|uniref:Zn(2)-C6 fungal-type domain-containing protein n=1 Tax=Mycena pura TaxID=153505 RepID=A0AAD6V224_9AGAR|nr:hypothetical protein GGX14DRAFT_574065 [Mycena pura]
MPPGRQQAPNPRRRTPLFIPDSDDEDFLTSRPPSAPRPPPPPPSVSRQEEQILTSSSPGVPPAFAPLDSGGPSRDMRTYARILASRRALERQNRPPPDPNRYRLPRMMATPTPEYVAAQARRAARRAEGKPSSSESNEESDGESGDDSEDDDSDEEPSSSSEPASSESSATRSPTPPLPVVVFQDDTPPVSPAHSPAPPARSPSPPVRPPTPSAAPIPTPVVSSAPVARALDTEYRKRLGREFGVPQFEPSPKRQRLAKRSSPEAPVQTVSAPAVVTRPAPPSNIVAVPVHTSDRVLRSSSRAAAPIATSEVVKAASAALDAADLDVPAKRGPGRPRGSKNKESKGKGKAPPARAQSPGRARLLPKSSVPAPGVAMAGPIPIIGEHPSRSAPFEQSLPVPPLDVDGLSSVFEHDALHKFSGGCDTCLFRNVKCDESRLGFACTPCRSKRTFCPNRASVEHQMETWNRLSSRFENLGNASINELIRDVVRHGDQAMALLEQARSSHSEFERKQQLLGDAMRQLRHGYGNERGVAHAAEITPAQRDEFAEFWVAGELSLPLRPPPASRPSQVSRRSWARAPFVSFARLDAQDRQDAVPGSNAPGGDPGQGSSRVNIAHAPSRPPTPSNESSNGEAEVEDELMPPPSS